RWHRDYKCSSFSSYVCVSASLWLHFLLVRSQYRLRLSRDYEFLVRRDDPDIRVGLDTADLCFLAAHLVLQWIQHDAGPVEVAADRAAEVDAVLADAAGEGEHVASAQGDEVGAKVVPHRFNEGVDR